MADVLKSGMTTDDEALISQYKKQWKSAKESGDTAAMNAAHSAAELVRAQYGYSGGDDGSQYIQREPTSYGENQQTTRTTTSGDDLSDYLRKQSAARVESALAGLEGAYKKSMAGYDAAEARLPQAYDAARNSAAAQNALEARAFDERAAASGLNSGTTGQAALSRSAAYQNAMAGIGQQQANAEADLQLQRANLQSEYETALAQARANGDAELAGALYQELIRLQNLSREEETTEWNRNYNMAQLGAGYGDYSGLNALGVNTSAYEAQLAEQANQGAVYGYSSDGGVYKVNTVQGRYFLESAAPGAVMVGGDGSRWVKNADGTVTIAKNGKSYVVGTPNVTGYSGTGGGNPSKDDGNKLSDVAISSISNAVGGMEMTQTQWNTILKNNPWLSSTMLKAAGFSIITPPEGAGSGGGTAENNTVNMIM